MLQDVLAGLQQKICNWIELVSPTRAENWAIDTAVGLATRKMTNVVMKCHIHSQEQTPFPATDPLPA